jgi:hypothetical protein
MNDRLGFVSGAGVLAALVVLAGVVGFTALRGPVMFSSGPLNAQSRNHPRQGVTSHSQLASKCGACHGAPWDSQTMTQRCLGCHDEVNAEMKGGTGVHGRLTATLSAPTCQGCHTEHHGASGALTVTDPTAFPHDLTGYSLRGHSFTPNGTRFSCTECHPNGLTAPFDQAVCVNCHTGIDSGFMGQHQTAYGKDCVLCHNGRVSHGTDFDHNKLAFKLTGKHAGVACGKCHSGASSFQASGRGTRDCQACHAKDDQHKGSFGTQCDQCHSTSGWAGATFDHKVFPVNHGNQGQASDCKTCHPTDTKSYSCYGCHQHSLGNTQAQHQNLTPAQLADCVPCHKGGSGGG